MLRKCTIVIVWVVVLGYTRAVFANADLSVSGIGCFTRLHDAATVTYTMRMTSPTCQISVRNISGANQRVTVTIENIDPDYVKVDRYDAATGVTKTDSSLQFTTEVTPGANSINVEPWHTYTDDFYFVALSDNQAQNTVEVNPVFTQIVRQVSTVNPVFFTNSGDLVQGSTDIPTMQAMYDEILRALTDESTIPMYPIAGNHDLWAPDVFQQYFGVSDYSFNFGNTQFVGLQTAVNGKSKGVIRDDQLVWLQNTLANSTKQSILFFHHPLQVPAWGKATCCYVDFTNRDELADVIDEGNVSLALVGHSQGYDDDTLTKADITTIDNTIRQVVIGGAGGRLKQPNSHHHFALIHVTPDAITSTMMSYDSFATTVNYSQNDGTSNSVSAEVTNEANIDVPYVRLKFKVANTYSDFVLYDSHGKYYNKYYTHVFDEYTVVYLDTAAPANTVTTYTLAPATQLHEASTNIVAVSGEVEVNPIPQSTQTLAAGFNVQSSQNVTTITQLQWGDSTNNYRSTWLEQPSDSAQQTNYSISGLLPLRTFVVKVNGKLYTKVMSDNAGIASFRYNTSNAHRRFSFSMLDVAYPHTVILTPASSGQPQVRIFSGDGKNISNWYALDKQSVGSYQTALADVTGDGITEVIVSTGGDTLGKLGVYTSDGVPLAILTPFGNQSKGGIQLDVADVTADGIAEMIVSSNSGKGVVQAYQYNTSTKAFSVLTTKVLYPTGFRGSVNITTLRGKIVVMGSGKRTTKLRVYEYNGTKQQFVLVAKKIMDATYSSTYLTKGDILGTGQSQLVFYGATEAGEKIQLFSLNPKNILRSKRQWNVRSGLQGKVQLLSGSIMNQARDALLLWSNRDPYYVSLAYEAKTLTSVTKTYPFGKKLAAGLNIGMIDTNSDGKIELAVAPTRGIPKIKLWYYNEDESRLVQHTSWLGYRTNFTGGINLAQSF